MIRCHGVANRFIRNEWRCLTSFSWKIWVSLYSLPQLYSSFKVLIWLFGRHLDVLAALDWLHDHIENEKPYLDSGRIGVWGESMGGATVLLAAASDSKSYINAIACESSYTSAKEAFKSWVPAHASGYINMFGYDLMRSDAFLEYMWSTIVLLFPYLMSNINNLLLFFYHSNIRV